MSDVICLWEKLKAIEATLEWVKGRIETMATSAELDAAIATLQATANDESEEIQRFIVLRDDERAGLQAALDAANALIAELQAGQITPEQLAAVEALAAQVEGLLADPRTPLPEPEPTP